MDLKYVDQVRCEALEGISGARDANQTTPGQTKEPNGLEFYPLGLCTTSFRWLACSAKQQVCTVQQCEKVNQLWKSLRTSRTFIKAKPSLFWPRPLEPIPQKESVGESCIIPNQQKTFHC